MALVIVTFRTDVTYAQNHILEDGLWRTFCGAAIPEAIREVWTDPRNPFIRAKMATCGDCVHEWNNGRRGGTSYVQEQQTESNREPASE